jgi:hypothetical protein
VKNEPFTGPAEKKKNNLLLSGADTVFGFFPVSLVLDAANVL